MVNLMPVRSLVRRGKKAFLRGKSLLTWKRWSFTGVPLVFGNAIPKSGSHLLQQILQGLCEIGPFAYVEHEPVREICADGRKRAQAEVLGDLKRLRPGIIGWGYLPAYPPYVEVLNQPGWTTYFILRDPRDTLVSQIFYATEIHQGHRMRDYYLSLPDMDARLKAAIGGVQGAGANLPDIRTRYERYLGWFGCPEVMVVRFEDFQTDRKKIITEMIAFLERSGFRLPVRGEQAVQRVMDAIQPGKSPTFRKGQSGEWRKYFKDEHKLQFKQITGDLLVRLGYEQDGSW